MVAISSPDADRFLRNAPNDVFVFLFHGSDAGLISERVTRCVRSFVPDLHDPFSIARLSADDLASDAQRLVDEARTIALFSSLRCVWVDVTSSGQAPGLDIVLKEPPASVRLVIAAGNLRRDSVLRKLCEQDKRAASIECHPDGPDHTARLIDEEMSLAGMSIEAEAKSLLVSLLGADRLAARSEIQKLVTYAHGAREISAADVAEITAASSMLGQDLAVKSAFEGQFEGLASHWPRAVLTSADAQGVLLAALRYALGLHARSARGAETSPWNAVQTRRSIKVLAEAVRRSRREPRLADAIALRSLWAVAGMAKRRA